MDVRKQSIPHNSDRSSGELRHRASRLQNVCSSPLAEPELQDQSFVAKLLSPLQLFLRGVRDSLDVLVTLKVLVRSVRLCGSYGIFAEATKLPIHTPTREEDFPSEWRLSGGWNLCRFISVPAGIGAPLRLGRR